MRKKNAPVVIVRKDKRLHKGWHLLAFMVTGGASAPVTAAKAATNTSYNARTRKLAAAGDGDEAAEFRAEHVPGSKEYKARHG
jgi:hypothetical protein